MISFEERYKLWQGLSEHDRMDSSEWVRTTKVSIECGTDPTSICPSRARGCFTLCPVLFPEVKEHTTESNPVICPCNILGEEVLKIVKSLIQKDEEQNGPKD